MSFLNTIIIITIIIVMIIIIITSCSLLFSGVKAELILSKAIYGMFSLLEVGLQQCQKNGLWGLQFVVSILRRVALQHCHLSLLVSKFRFMLPPNQQVESLWMKSVHRLLNSLWNLWGFSFPRNCKYLNT